MSIDYRGIKMLPLNFPVQILALFVSLLFLPSLHIYSQNQIPSSPSQDSKDYTVIEDQSTAVPILSQQFKQRQTAKLRLNNGLEAYIISDPSAEQSAAALAVNVGSWSNPEDAPGMAHFLEHMLFLGTKKYPEEAAFDHYLTENGGSSNAFTKNLNTVYMFVVNHFAFEGALDRFSSFFKEPLFNPSGVSREMHAIDQEYARNRNSDEWRKELVLKELDNQEHPTHGFHMGNLKTISAISPERLKEWYKEHYSANLMHLVIYSALPLEELKKEVVQNFQGIPDYHKSPLHTSVPLIDKNHLQHYIYIEPLKDSHSLILRWELPPELALQRDSAPEDIACYILGHEGKGSLLAQLKKEHLAEALGCGGQLHGKDHLIFTMHIELTDTGLNKIDTVIERCFQTLAFLREKPIPKQIFDEVKKLQTIHYQYPVRLEPFNEVMQLADSMMDEPLETYPLHTEIVQKYDPKMLQLLFNSLTPQNSQIIIMSKATDVVFDKREEFMDIAYSIKEIPESKIEAWSRLKGHPDITLPPANPFIPENLNLINEEKALNKSEPSETEEIKIRNPQPKLVLDDQGVKIYEGIDKLYLVPEVSWYLAIKSPLISGTDPRSIALCELYVKALTEKLNTLSYEGLVGGLVISAKCEEEKIKIVLSGYNDKAFLFLNAWLEQLQALSISEEEFATYKNIQIRQYQNFVRENPLEQASETLKSIIYNPFVTNKEKLNSLVSVNNKDFNDFIKNVFTTAYVEGLLYGNMEEGEGVNVWNLLKEKLKIKKPYLKEDQTPLQILQLPENGGPFLVETNIKAQGNAAILAIQHIPFSLKNRSIQQIVEKSIDVPFYSALRTKQQTGYVAFTKPEDIKKNLFTLFAVQSDTHDGRDLLSRFELVIDTYFQEYGSTDLTEDKFNLIRQSLIATLEQVPSNLNTMRELLTVLAFDYNDFEWRLKRKDAMKALSYPETLAIAKEMFSRSNKRRLGVMVHGKIDSEHELRYKKVNNLNLIRKKSTFESVK